MVETLIQVNNSSSLKVAKGPIVLALSGGIDSAFALAVQLKQGIAPSDIFAFRFKWWAPEKKGDEKMECAELEEIRDAADIAHHFGVENFKVLYWEDMLYQEVFSPTFQQYLSGITPNPDMLCNEKVKFGALASYAFEVLKAQKIVTGHHVRSRKNPFRLLAGRDPEKDQSYFLGTSKREILERAYFPVGEYLKEKEVKVMARELGVPEKIINKQSSRDMCLLAKSEKDLDNPKKISLEELLREEAKKRGIDVYTGQIMDLKTGREIGTHNGIMLYTMTIGQKVGFKNGFGVPGGNGRRYLVGKDIAKNLLYVGSFQPTASEVRVSNFNWLIEEKPSFPFKCSAKIRTPQKAQSCVADKTGEDEILVKFDNPQNSVAPGQACVLYDGEVVLGGGIITG